MSRHGVLLMTASHSCREKKEVSKKDAEWSKGNKLWLAGAGMATLAYFVLSVGSTSPLQQTGDMMKRVMMR